MATIRSGFTIDTRDLAKLMRDLEESVPGIKADLNAQLRAGAERVAVTAATMASWSSRIPSSIRVGGAGARVVVKAGDAHAPHAAPYEHNGVPGEFRHPVFGNRSVWVAQQARPFLTPALAREAEPMTAKVLEGVSLVLSSHGL